MEDSKIPSPAELSELLPRLYEQDGNQHAPVPVKLFDPCSNWTWYLTEYDPQHDFAFGLVVGHEEELGYVSIGELRKLRNRLGLPLERDLWWDPTTPLSKVRSGEVR